jgi:hypothetical protein
MVRELIVSKHSDNAQKPHIQAFSPLHIPHHGGNANGRVHQDIVSNPLT